MTRSSGNPTEPRSARKQATGARGRAAATHEAPEGIELADDEAVVFPGRDRSSASCAAARMPSTRSASAGIAPGSDAEGEEAQAHPTKGGLRIGKDLPEREPDDPYDAELEWDRDGQYFHYLTKWMHALDLLSRHLGEHEPNRWARELAQAAHAGFTYAPAPGAAKRMYWKMRHRHHRSIRSL